ncbi:MAG TPA: RQC domain-containing protein [Bacteroidia bacterium]|jgi:ATP-dependent DNA helicase RecQ|nr:RQC domain-containing protein [Bacteroidia bacterium]
MKSAAGTGEQMPPVSKEENLKTLTTQILKTMVLLGKPFGQNYLINLLTGNPDATYRDLVHTKLETFGAVPRYMGNKLVCVLHYLVDLGLIETNLPACNVLKVTDAGRAWLDEPRDLMARTARMGFTGLESYLRKALRAHRGETAKLTGTESWAIFTDYMLDRIVLGKPLSLEYLLRVPGFSTSKCENYGAGIIRVVQNVLENYEEFRRQALVQEAKGSGYQTVKKMFTDNFTLPEIARVASLKIDTVVRYLCNLHEIGQVDMVPWIEKNINSKSLFKGVEYFTRVQAPTLREGYATLGLDYNTLRFAYLYKRDTDARKEEMRLSA